MGGNREGNGASVGEQIEGLAGLEDKALYQGILGVKGMYNSKGPSMDLVKSTKF